MQIVRRGEGKLESARWRLRYGKCNFPLLKKFLSISIFFLGKNGGRNLKEVYIFELGFCQKCEFFGVLIWFDLFKNFLWYDKSQLDFTLILGVTQKANQRTALFLLFMGIGVWFGMFKCL